MNEEEGRRMKDGENNDEVQTRHQSEEKVKGGNA